MIGRRLSHYRIVTPLGSGGMGVAYRARDEHLERDVALKVLPEGALADDASRTRFRREALALSRLSHPAIGTIFDFDTEEGTDFLVMEFVPGSTLAAKLVGGPLDEAEAVVIGLQVAEALEAAHEQGVVHRDLKPANVMVTDRGRVKVLDFGLAKLRARKEAPATSSITGPQAVMGTLPYMAPEQLLGGEIDPRADLFAFGALLYEAATGRPPFAAPTGPAIVNEILNQSPAPPRRLRPALSSTFEAVVLRCLEKDPARRYPSANELAAELRRLAVRGADRAAPPSGPRIESLAVLPLENLSRDPEQEYFADGMTEALIADLARIGALRVVSRTSAMRYKGVRKPLPEMARELGVDAIVEGSVLRAGDRVRISAQLIEAATDRHLWAERYERDVRDVLAIQSEVAEAVAREIQVKLTQQEKTRLASPRRVKPEAHEPYLKGRHHWNLRTREALERAIEFFNRAIEQDPTYAPAYSGLADCYNILADSNAYPPQVAFPRAEAAARRALDLDDHLAEAHTSLAYVQSHHHWDWSESEREFRRAIELDRGYPTAHQWYGILLACLRRFDEAIAHGLEAVKLDPLSRILYTSVGDTFYYARRYEDAMAIYRQAIDFSPDFMQVRFDLGRSLEQAGRHDEAIAEFEVGLRMSGGDPGLSPALACTYGFSGRPAEARAILEALKERARTAYVPPYSIASIHASLGDVEPAFEWLEKAHAARDRAMIYLQVNPRFDRLRADPRFDGLVRRMGFPD